MTTLLWMAVLVTALYLGQRQLFGMREVGRSSTGRATDVSIVIPARNEAANLPTLLTSLQSLTRRPTDVIVVDDGSTDGTAEVARAGGATVLTVTALPSGWTGKAWACHQGAQASTGRMILFLDADTVLAPDALDGLLALRDASGGLVSVQPFHHAEKQYEQLSCYFNAVSLMGSGAFRRQPPQRPMAFGPCLLTSRSDYELVGGHAVVRAEIVDDAQLAAAYARAGLSVRCATGGGVVGMRMYPGGLRQLAEGWTKNIASGARQADARSASAAAAWVAAHCAVAVGAVSAVGSVAMPLWAVAWVAVGLQFRLILRRIGSFHPWTWLLFPVPLLAFLALFARSMILTYLRRSVRWRGRSVGLPGLRASREES